MPRAQHFGCGGFSIVEREWDVEDVRTAVSWEERWRYKHRKSSDPVKPRQIVADYLTSPHITPYIVSEFCDDACTFDPSLPSNKHVRTLEHISDFVELPIHQLLCTWRVSVAGAWKYDEVIHVTEARSVLMAARRICRSSKNYGKTHLICCDDFGSVLAFSKGRASSFELRLICQRLLGLSLTTGCCFHIRWVASEFNPGDYGSRNSLSGAKAVTVDPATLLWHACDPHGHPAWDLWGTRASVAQNHLTSTAAAPPPAVLATDKDFDIARSGSETYVSLSEEADSCPLRQHRGRRLGTSGQDVLRYARELPPEDTGRHFQLQGASPSGHLWTTLAAAYPTRMARTVAHAVTARDLGRRVNSLKFRCVSHDP